MNDFIPEFRDISNWDKQAYSSTGGTRAKKIYTNPTENISYFFKGSKVLEDNEIRYPEEFWSEVVASKVGSWLGFRTLDYNIGYDSFAKLQNCGCLSKSMIIGENVLTEGVEYLRGFNSRYDPSKDEDEYTFMFIEAALDSFGLADAKQKFVELLLFDLIISNSDRHQENWGFISLYDEKNQDLNAIIETTKNPLRRAWVKFRKMHVGLIRDMNYKTDLTKDIITSPVFLSNQSFLIKSEFSPIYDSGCCLGRELTEQRIMSLLSQPKLLDKYIENGKAEVRWYKGQKVSHFELANHLKPYYAELITEVQNRVRAIYKQDDLNKIVTNIDKQSSSHCSLPEYRKELMIKILSLRIERFLNL